MAQTIGATTTNFALDVQGLPEVIYTSAGNSYLHLPGVIMAESAEGEVRYLLSDGLGSVRQAADETGAVVSYNEFDPYGNPVQNGSEPYGFTGEWWENEVGLLHLRARWLLPQDGIFLSRDAVESEPPYLYVRGNPINYADPTGYQSPGEIGMGGGLVITCVLAAPECAAAILVGATVIVAIGAVVIIYVSFDYAAQHPELSRPTYPPGPMPAPAPAPPQVYPDPQAGTGENPLSLPAIYQAPRPQSGGTPNPRPTSTPPPFPIPTCTPDRDNNNHKVLTVGDGNFGYSNSLYTLHPDWKITATNFGNGSNSQDYDGGYGNLTRYTNVDATKLHSGRITKNNRYDAIIFNNPAVTINNHVDGPQTARLISLFRRSAYRVLAPGGEIHINVTKSLLLKYPEIYPRLGLPDNKASTLDNLPRFGQSRYYAPYTPHYSSGDPMQFYRDNPTNVRVMLNFVYR
ncbi:MAG: DUF2431 domain-containing protein [Chloroflexi bacterium]|nr:DUF2431 domain-containing protein [Chloroflexota bacterium]